MAISESAFFPSLWSNKLLDHLKDNFSLAQKPKRSKGAQLLRDAALGHEEYPPDPKAHYQGRNMTATQVMIQQEYANQAVAAMAQKMDDDILDAMRYSMSNIRIVSS